MFNSENFSNVSEGRNAKVTCSEKPYAKVFKNKNMEKVLKGTVVNRACPSINIGSLKITTNSAFKFYFLILMLEQSDEINL